MGWSALGCGSLGLPDLGGGSAGEAPVLDRNAGDRRPTTGRVRELPDGFSRVNQKQDGLDRESLLFQPSGKRSKRPLLIGLHGNEGDSAWMYRNCKLGRLVHDRGWFGLFPECDVWSKSDPKPDLGDARYLSAVLDRVLADHPIDRSRVFVTGFSGGGMRAYRMASQCSDRVTAIAVCGAVIGHREKGLDSWNPDVSGASSVSILHVHGKRDDTVDPRGGEMAERPGIERVGMIEGLEIWARHVGATEVQQAQPPAGCPSSRVTTRKWESPSGTVIQAVLDQQMGHVWAPYMTEAAEQFFTR